MVMGSPNPTPTRRAYPAPQGLSREGVSITRSPLCRDRRDHIRAMFVKPDDGRIAAHAGHHGHGHNVREVN
jgi:hypothetical protein